VQLVVQRAMTAGSLALSATVLANTIIRPFVPLLVFCQCGLDQPYLFPGRVKKKRFCCGTRTD
jgi:hypothetical protein